MGNMSNTEGAHSTALALIVEIRFPVEWPAGPAHEWNLHVCVSKQMGK